MNIKELKKYREGKPLFFDSGYYYNNKKPYEAKEGSEESVLVGIIDALLANNKHEVVKNYINRTLLTTLYNTFETGNEVGLTNNISFPKYTFDETGHTKCVKTIYGEWIECNIFTEEEKIKYREMLNEYRKMNDEYMSKAEDISKKLTAEIKEKIKKANMEMKQSRVEIRKKYYSVLEGLVKV